MYYKQTEVSPKSYHVGTYDCQAITFSYNGVVHSINRRGKHKIREFIGADGTFTLTNGVDKFIKMNPHAFSTQSVTLNDGSVTYYRR